MKHETGSPHTCLQSNVGKNQGCFWKWDVDVLELDIRVWIAQLSSTKTNFYSICLCQNLGFTTFSNKELEKKLWKSGRNVLAKRPLEFWGLDSRAWRPRLLHITANPKSCSDFGNQLLVMQKVARWTLGLHSQRGRHWCGAARLGAVIPTCVRNVIF